LLCFCPSRHFRIFLLHLNSLCMNMVALFREKCQFGIWSCLQCAFWSQTCKSWIPGHEIATNVPFGHSVMTTVSSVTCLTIFLPIDP
jgi:hypothetical protein